MITIAFVNPDKLYFDMQERAYINQKIGRINERSIKRREIKKPKGLIARLLSRNEPDHDSKRNIEDLAEEDRGSRSSFDYIDLNYTPVMVLDGADHGCEVNEVKKLENVVNLAGVKVHVGKRTFGLEAYVTSHHVLTPPVSEGMFDGILIPGTYNFSSSVGMEELESVEILSKKNKVLITDLDSFKDELGKAGRELAAMLKGIYRKTFENHPPDMTIYVGKQVFMEGKEFDSSRDEGENNIKYVYTMKKDIPYFITNIPGIQKVVPTGDSGFFKRAFRAEEEGTGNPLVVKVVDLEISDDKVEDILKKLNVKDIHSLVGLCAEEVSRYKAMIQSLENKEISNRNIIKLREAFQRGNKFIFVEDDGGENLSNYLKSRGDIIPLDLGAQILMQICHGLSDEVGAHSVGFYHGDIKLENAVIQGDVIKLIDWGLAGRFDLVNGNYDGERHIGSIFTTSPERFRGNKPDACSDIWSVGVMGHKLLTGRYPSFLGFTRDEISNLTMGGRGLKEDVLYSLFDDMYSNPEQYSNLYAGLGAEIRMRALNTWRSLGNKGPLSTEEEQRIEVLSGVIKNCLQNEPSKRYGGKISVLEKELKEITS